MKPTEHFVSPQQISEQLVLVLEDGVDNIVQQAEEATPTHITIVDTNEVLNMALAEVELDAHTESEFQIETLETTDGINAVEQNVALGPPSPPTDSANHTEEIEFEDDLPNDPWYASQSGPQMVDAPDAWEITKGNSDVTIAICDSGIKYDHEDLAANMDDSVYNHGHDFINDDPDPYPRTFTNDGDKEIEDHGTRTAGIVGAVTNNDVGVAGISDCTLLSVKIADWMTGGGWGSGWAIVNGVEWAVSSGADVILVNVDGSGLDEWYPFNEAVTYAESSGVITIAAAGNGGGEYDEIAYASQSHMSVAAAHTTETLAGFSSYGDFVNVTAPGTGGYTTYPAADGEPADEYAGYGGTSMAAPVVAGIAGLVLSVDNSLSIDELKEVIEETAIDMGLPEVQQGHGLVNAAAAVRKAIGPAVAGVTGANIRGSEVSEVYWNTEASGTTVGIDFDDSDGDVSGLDTIQMYGTNAEKNMEGFDFEETWDSNPNDYPTLAWQDEPLEEGPAVADYANEEGIVDADGLEDAFADWKAGDIEMDLLREVFITWRNSVS